MHFSTIKLNAPLWPDDKRFELVIDGQTIKGVTSFTLTGSVDQTTKLEFTTRILTEHADVEAQAVVVEQK